MKLPPPSSRAVSTLTSCCAGRPLAAAPAGSGSLEAGLDSLQVGYEIYQVQPGDTVENIAVRFGVSATRLGP